MDYKKKVNIKNVKNNTFTTIFLKYIKANFFCFKKILLKTNFIIFIGRL